MCHAGRDPRCPAPRSAQNQDSPRRFTERLLGHRGPPVCPIGFGAFKIGRNQGTKYPAEYALPEAESATKLLNTVLDLGINYIDTAPAYGLSEERIGAAIGHRRREYTLSTKVGETFAGGVSSHDFSRGAIELSIHRSLSRMKTDVLDLVFLHSPGDDLAILDHTDAVPTLVELRKKGLVRGIGLSGKTVAGAYAALGWADALMVEYHLADQSHEGVIEAAASAGVGIVVKKGLAAGKLAPAEALRFVLSNPGVSTLVVGSLCVSHIEQNLSLSASLRAECAEAARCGDDRAGARISPPVD